MNWDSVWYRTTFKKTRLSQMCNKNLLKLNVDDLIQILIYIRHWLHSSERKPKHSFLPKINKEELLEIRVYTHIDTKFMPELTHTWTVYKNLTKIFNEIPFIAQQIILIYINIYYIRQYTEYIYRNKWAKKIKLKYVHGCVCVYVCVIHQ